MDYYDYIHQHIFQAAGMSSSRFYTRPERAQNPNIAHPYSQRGASGQSTNGPRTDVSNLMTFIGSPAGDAYTTVEDMLRYSQALQSHLLLDASHTDLLMTGKVPFRAIPWHQNEKYAYGLAESTVNGQRLVGHDGGANGIAMQFDMFPSLGWTVVILSNYDPGTNFNALVKEAEELVTQS